MIINSTTLNALRVGFQTSFQGGLAIAASQFGRVATTVPSSAKTEDYGWLKSMPSVREWVGDRLLQNLAEGNYSIKNKPYELTIGVDRDDIEDDTLGVYAPMFAEMGRSVGAHPDQLVWPLLAAGFNTNCYDGQYFFDTDHPVVDATGATVNVANTDAGSGTPWYLLCTKQVLKPIIFQQRKPFKFTALDNPDDQNVFFKKKFVYGSDGRDNVGYGFWQMAWGSKQTLDATHYANGRGAILGMKGDGGRPLGLMPDLLVVPPSLESAGRTLLQSQLINGGESNPWAGTAELLVVPWLA